jgi:hypothetical protein
MNDLTTFDPATARLPAKYEAARAAIAECSRVDECKDWADKAAALASYARQAKDDSLRVMALRIQARAERRAGELLKQIPAANGARTDLQPHPGAHTRSQAAKDAGLSKHQKDTALRVANVPQDEFDAAVESASPPTLGALAARGTASRATESQPDIAHLARKARYMLMEFATFCGAHDPIEIARAMGDPDSCRGNVEMIDAWLDRFVTNLKSEDEAA